MKPIYIKLTIFMIVGIILTNYYFHFVERLPPINLTEGMKNNGSKAEITVTETPSITEQRIITTTKKNSNTIVDIQVYDTYISDSDKMSRDYIQNKALSFDNSDDTSNLGDFDIHTKSSFTPFEYPNNHKFKVKYNCRRTSTGMFTDCGPYSANIGWDQDPYKGCNCKECK